MAAHRLLATGLAAGSVAAGVAATRAQRGGARAEVRTGKLLGASWPTVFVALFLAITGLTSSLDVPELQTVLWRPVPDWWSACSTWVRAPLAPAGGGAYALATLLEPRRSGDGVRHRLAVQQVGGLVPAEVGQ